MSKHDDATTGVYPATGEFAIARHPGEFLREVYLEPLELKVVDVADALGVGRQTVSELINARRAVSIDMAQRLAVAFGRSPRSWLNMQMLYDLNHSRTDTSEVKTLYPAAL